MWFCLRICDMMWFQWLNIFLWKIHDDYTMETTNINEHDDNVNQITFAILFMNISIQSNMTSFFVFRSTVFEYIYIRIYKLTLDLIKSICVLFIFSFGFWLHSIDSIIININIFNCTAKNDCCSILLVYFEILIKSN